MCSPTDTSRNTCILRLSGMPPSPFYLRLCCRTRCSPTKQTVCPSIDWTQPASERWRSFRRKHCRGPCSFTRYTIWIVPSRKSRIFCWKWKLVRDKPTIKLNVLINSSLALVCEPQELKIWILSLCRFGSVKMPCWTRITDGRCSWPIPCWTDWFWLRIRLM